MIPNWPRAHGLKRPTAVMRQRVEDFVVEERLPFEASGSGEFVLLEVEKRDANTRFVAEQLARFAGVTPRQVSYAGLKDRRAIARQFFSVHLNKQTEPQWTDFSTPQFRVLSHQRHQRKLRIGSLSGNRFEITLRDCSGPLDPAALPLISQRGVPNYFGPQRFGRDGNNINAARAMFADPGRKHRRDQRSMALSAARSLLFNDYLSRRVVAENWNHCLLGDIMMLAGSNSVFVSDDQADSQRRLDCGDIHVAGPMFGKGDSNAHSEAFKLEQLVATHHPELTAGLSQAGLKLARRSLRLIPQSLQTEALEGGVARISFELPAGNFATSVVRELVDVSGL